MSHSNSGLSMLRSSRLGLVSSSEANGSASRSRSAYGEVSTEK